MASPGAIGKLQSRQIKEAFQSLVTRSPLAVSISQRVNETGDGISGIPVKINPETDEAAYCREGNPVLGSIQRATTLAPANWTTVTSVLALADE